MENSACSYRCPSYRYLRGTNPSWRHDDFNTSRRHVIHEAGDEPLSWQYRNRPKHCNVGGNCSAGIGDRFRLKFPFLYLKVVRQHGGIASKASHAAIGVLEHDDVKLPAASRNFSGNFTDSPEQTQLLQQPWGDSTADVPDYDGLAGLNSQHIGWIHTHIGATDNDCFHIWHCPRQRGHKCAGCRLAGSKVFVTFQHGVESAQGIVLRPE